jgi:hypothetical protein
MNDPKNSADLAATNDQRDVYTAVCLCSGRAAFVKTKIHVAVFMFLIIFLDGCRRQTCFDHTGFRPQAHRMINYD